MDIDLNLLQKLGLNSWTLPILDGGPTMKFAGVNTINNSRSHGYSMEPSVTLYKLKFRYVETT